MVGFITNPDDNGIRALIRENRKDDNTKVVTPTEATLRIRSVGERQPQEEQPQEQQQHARQYHGRERRSGKDRRHGQDNVMLDTRTNRERRRNFTAQDQQKDDIPVRGIDIKI